MVLSRRRPSGTPSWPIVLLAGCESGGKSWTAAEATGHEWFGSSLWLEIGEGSANEYIRVPGADYEIHCHDGSYAEILAQIRDAATEPIVDGKPNLLVVDSMTELWDLLSDEQQTIANHRRKGKSGGDATITMDQWNAAKKRWGYVVSELRRFPGPVITTARLDQVAVVAPSGQPTGDTTWKIRTEKNYPFEVQVVMQARVPRQWVMTGITSTYLLLPEGGYMKWPGYSVVEQLGRMGLDPTTARLSTYVEPDAGRVIGEADRARNALREILDAKRINTADAVAKFKADGHGDLATSNDSVAITALVDHYGASAVTA